MRINFCELTNISFEFKRERYIGHGLSIRSMPSYIGAIIDEDRRFTIPSQDRRWIIYVVPHRDYVGHPDWEISNNIRVVADTLLLYCGEHVQFGAKYTCEYDGKGKVNRVLMGYGGLFNSSSANHNEMHLNNEKILQVKRLFSLLMSAYDNHFVQIPLTFYREACAPYAIPWKAMIYLSTALEAIFLKNGERGKAYELAKKVACFLSLNNQFEHETHRGVFALYKSRNAILHDGNQSPAIQVKEQDTGTQFEFNCIDLTKSSYDILQRCLKKILYEQIPDKQTLLSLLRQRSANLQIPKLIADERVSN